MRKKLGREEGDEKKGTLPSERTNAWELHDEGMRERAPWRKMAE